MPFGEIKLLPGVNVERTPTLLEAAVSSSQLIRYKDDLVQKYGGWNKFFSFAVNGTIRDLHAWEDLNATNHLLAGTTQSLGVVTNNSYADISPQLLTNNSTVSFSTTTGSLSVSVYDSNIANPSTYDAVFIATPVAAGGTVLSGLYQIQTLISSTAYTILSATAAATAVTNAGALPLFASVASSPLVSVTLTAHALTSGNVVTFNATTTFNALTIYGSYPATVLDSNNFNISASAVASASGTTWMNSNHVQFVYYITQGPAAAGAGYGTGGYGSGAYGSGVVPSSQVGTAIAASDWTSDNWGKLALACPKNGGVYQYDPTGGLTTAALVTSAPLFNGGIFVSNSLQILFAWSSTPTSKIGIAQDPMLVRWSDLGDYTQFQTLTTNQAGSFRIPIGSTIRGGMAVANQNLFWTDLDLWAANYAGYPLVFGFNKIGSGAGLISSHAAQQLRNGVYWMGPSNFYSYTGGGVTVIPCPVWDFVFQNINTSFVQNVRAMPNTPFNEVGWLFPSASSTTGECDSYVKMNITSPGNPWDCGRLSRSAWIDQTVFGNPIAGSSSGIIYQHETTNDADGSPLLASFTTGYFYLAEGEEFVFVDQIIPDMKWGTYGITSAQVQITLNAINYPGDTPTVYGPYLMTASTRYISVRIRARQMSVTISSSDTASFWRLGKIRYRFAPDGRNG